MLQQEADIRTKLGIPSDAESVLIFGETSHWDPNWLYTTHEYFDIRIRTVLDRAIEELCAEPRRIFSIESIYFIQLYWQRCPDKREALSQLINEGRLRLTGSGITTPDTVLPATEAIIRDYLLGQEWLRKKGMLQEPTLAYLPDDFGVSPELPALLASMGYDKTCVTRIDGMYFVGCDYCPKGRFPLTGSSADVLQQQEKTLDFVWQAQDGSEVLCHWNAFTYFQGDMLAYVGAIRWMGKVYGCALRSERHIARRIRSYVRQLRPLSKTPYMYCPIGCDFNDPIPNLIELLDRYNERRYPDTGIWVVNAGMDDYLALVDCHRDKLPAMQLDPNPYWMGFYASRQEAKLRCNRIERKLVLAEKLSAIDGGIPHSAEPSKSKTGSDGASDHANEVATDPNDSLRRAWDILVLSNHHDFITGTSPDRIWLAEQQPWLREAEALVDSALAHVAPMVLAAGERSAPPSWQFEDGRLAVNTGHYSVELSEAHGGCIVSFKDANGQELLNGPANDLVCYRDTGGLWRMGHEFTGGSFRECERSRVLPASIRAAEKGELLEVQVRSQLCGREFTRWLWFRNDSPIVRMRLVGAASRKRTVTCSFPTVLQATSLVMNVPGGVVTRPAQKVYDPTFWPARSFAHLHDNQSDVGLAAFLGGPAAVCLRDSHALEWLAFRNAPKETAFGILPVLAHPARGTDPHDGAFDYAVLLTTGGDWRENQLPRRVRVALRAAMFAPDAPDLDQVANAAVYTDERDVFVTALKIADRGEGVIARLRSVSPEPVNVKLLCPKARIHAASLCDALERDLEQLVPQSDHVMVPVSRTVTSVRLVLERTGEG